MFNKYYKIKGCFPRINEETKKEEFVILASEIMGKGLLRDFTRYFPMEKDEFLKKFGSYYKKDEFNKGLEGKILQTSAEFHEEINGIVENVPDEKK